MESVEDLIFRSIDSMGIIGLVFQKSKSQYGIRFFDGSAMVYWLDIFKRCIDFYIRMCEFMNKI